MPCRLTGPSGGPSIHPICTYDVYTPRSADVTMSDTVARDSAMVPLPPALCRQRMPKSSPYADGPLVLLVLVAAAPTQPQMYTTRATSRAGRRPLTSDRFPAKEGAMPWII